MGSSASSSILFFVIGLWQGTRGNHVSRSAIIVGFAFRNCYHHNWWWLLAPAVVANDVFIMMPSNVICGIGAGFFFNHYYYYLLFCCCFMMQGGFTVSNNSKILHIYAWNNNGSRRNFDADIYYSSSTISFIIYLNFVLCLVSFPVLIFSHFMSYIFFFYFGIFSSWSFSVFLNSHLYLLQVVGLLHA